MIELLSNIGNSTGQFQNDPANGINIVRKIRAEVFIELFNVRLGVDMEKIFVRLRNHVVGFNV